MIKYCTKDNPYTPERHNTGDRWKHDNVHGVDEQKDGWSGGDIVTMECKNCDKRWTEELPQ